MVNVVILNGSLIMPVHTNAHVGSKVQMGQARSLTVSGAQTPPIASLNGPVETSPRRNQKKHIIYRNQKTIIVD